MDGTIYDDCAKPAFAFDDLSGSEDQAEPVRRRPFAPASRVRVAVISNPRSHRNKHRPLCVPHGVRVETPRTRADLRHALAGLVREGVELVIVAGGDGTVRDVLTCGADVWGGFEPTIGVLPCGKTNALAIDLGVPEKWGIADMVEAWQAGRIKTRAPIEVERPGEDSAVLGFLFGAGAFVDATELAQSTHRLGAFNNLAVGLSILGAVGSTVFGGEGSLWRRGKRMAIRYGVGARARHNAALSTDGNRFIMLASTMHRLPLGANIFGERRSGLKTLVVDAPPHRFLANFLRVMRGANNSQMERDGIHRVDAREIEIELEGGFVLDGERFPAGSYLLREGAPVTFVAP